eukprot:scaffold6168_cov420-Prasinococcus_capsulatus_cf.AAC.9
MPAARLPCPRPPTIHHHPPPGAGARIATGGQNGRPLTPACSARARRTAVGWVAGGSPSTATVAPACATLAWTPGMRAPCPAGPVRPCTNGLMGGARERRLATLPGIAGRTRRGPAVGQAHGCGRFIRSWATACPSQKVLALGLRRARAAGQEFCADRHLPDCQDKIVGDARVPGCSLGGRGWGLGRTVCGEDVQRLRRRLLHTGLNPVAVRWTPSDC